MSASCLRLAVAGTALLLVACSPDLEWVEPKTYTPPAVDAVYVEGRGVDDTVAILPIASAPTAVSKRLTNSGDGGVGAAYEIRELIERMRFRYPPGSWTPADTVVDDTVPGPTPLASGDTAGFSHPVAMTDSCGLYRETLHLDVNDAVAEAAEGNNESVDHFFVPSGELFNIAVDTLNDGFFHDPNPAGRVHTHDFRVVPSGPSPPPAVIVGFSYTTNHTSSATANPTGRCPMPCTVAMTVVPSVDNVPFPTGERLVGKVTVISADGCVLKQQTARVNIEHPT